MTETKTVVTTEEVEMVECSSCGQGIEKEEAHYFVIRNEKNKDDFTGQTEGWACEHCVEKPISFPVIFRTLGENTGWLELATAFLLILLSIATIMHILFIT
jgi:hypothetical protein